MGTPLAVGRIERRIYLIRGLNVMLDRDLAELYGVETKALNLAVKRNAFRFPNDFMFKLTQDENPNLRFQIETSSWGGRRYYPYAFTENGVSMLSSVLSSKHAVRVNIGIRGRSLDSKGCSTEETTYPTDYAFWNAE